MGIDNKFNGLVGNGFHGCHNLFGKCSKLIVYQDDAVITSEHANIAAATFQHVNHTGDMSGFYLNFIEPGGLSEKLARDGKEQKYEKSAFHRWS